MTPRHTTLTMMGLLLLAAALVPAWSPDAAAPEGDRIVSDPALAARIDEVATRALDGLQMAGMSVAVRQHGELAFAAGYGYSDVVRRVPAEPHTLYRLGSIGKTFTAASVLLLAQEQRLALDDSIATHLPHVPSHLSDVRVRHLLSHTSGLDESAIGPELEATGGVGLDPDEILDSALSRRLLFEPGSQWLYSNAGYMLVGNLIERVTGTTSGDHIARSVLEPIGLHDTRSCPDEPPVDENWAQGYEVDQRNLSRVIRLGRRPGLSSASPISMAVVGAAGSLCSDVVDLVRWPEVLETQLLEPETFAEMRAATRLSDGTAVGYGLGLQLRQYGRHRALGHSGVINGFVTILAHFPDDETTVALLVNTSLSEEDARALFEEVVAATFDEPRTAWIDEYGLERQNHDN